MSEIFCTKQGLYPILIVQCLCGQPRLVVPRLVFGVAFEVYGGALKESIKKVIVVMHMMDGLRNCMARFINSY